MANRRSYKTDESFLEKISIGAVGTRRVFDDLFRQGHNPIELERGSMSFKIWKTIKIKRIRVPDILCINCGRRVESRAKTKLEITMSHSFSNQERGWDYGLEDDDFVALAVCKRVGDRPVDWEADNLVQYVSVRDLRVAQRARKTISVEPKGAQEGFEARITWPSSVASSVGTIVRVTPERLQYKRQADNRTITLSLSKKELGLTPLIQEGDIVASNQVLASVVPVMTRFPCSTKATEQEYVTQLSSSSLSERYKASKALSYFSSLDSVNALAHKMSDDKDHIYVRLEAASSLARRGDERGISFVDDCLSDQYLENRLEAARALAKLAKEFTPEVVDEFSKPGQTQRAGMAWALSKSAQFSLEHLLQALIDDDARRWVAYIIGTQDPQSYVGQIELLRQDDPEVYFAVTVLWQIMNSWIYGLEEYG